MTNEENDITFNSVIRSGDKVTESKNKRRNCFLKTYNALLTLTNNIILLSESDQSAIKSLAEKWRKGKWFSSNETALVYKIYFKYFPDNKPSPDKPTRTKLSKTESDQLKSKL